MIPAQLVEQLSTALARWDGRGPSDDDTLETGKALADGPPGAGWGPRRGRRMPTTGGAGVIGHPKGVLDCFLQLCDGWVAQQSIGGPSRLPARAHQTRHAGHRRTAAGRTTPACPSCTAIPQPGPSCPAITANFTTTRIGSVKSGGHANGHHRARARHRPRTTRAGQSRKNWLPALADGVAKAAIRPSPTGSGVAEPAATSTSEWPTTAYHSSTPAPKARRYRPRHPASPLRAEELTE